jgi:RNA polymerase-binding transcription factor DksA
MGAVGKRPAVVRPAALNGTQLGGLRRKVASLSRRAQLALRQAEGELQGEDSDQLRELGRTGDGAIAEAEFERDVAEAGQARAMLAAAEAARGRMACGDYGWCIDCGNAIGFARLSVEPTASRCVACQERLEQRGTSLRTAR